MSKNSSIDQKMKTKSARKSESGKKEIDPIKNFFAGGVGGACLVIIGHPPDTIKVRLQTMPKPKKGEKPIYTGAFDCVKKTVKKEGFLSLYRGVGSMFVGVTPTSALSFFGNSIGKKIQTPSRDDGDFSLPQLFFAGSVAGVTNTIVLTPVERAQEAAKLNKNVSSTEYNGSFDCARQLYKKGGIQNLYRGAGITIIRGIPQWGVYFCTYDGLQRVLKSEKHPKEKLSTWRTILAGGTAGLFSWLIGMPADVLKSRLQSAPSDKYPNGARDVFRELIKKEGVGALYKGTTAILIRAFPANAACFLGYEVAMKALNHLY
ncbi:unnamed protein product [Rotaria sp. Silwood1]|nr:unnamed protein product [Rotaria sp. Silwood1]CAF1370810.1 unnamed protein product [Rotaria sp. Silwood1]CAF3498563.1 unnamed protein product [Rotaria sp. Silwood1]CAF3601620.1 unnamed protein product [Rotaria sp. Silwood1]CAF4511467.1 unnamed protein product [Rotaria sp. Silwood1]